MRFSVTPPDLDKAWQGTQEAIAGNLTRAMQEAGVALQADLRQETEAAFRGNRLPKTWRLKNYPKSGSSIEPSAYVHSRAAKIIDAFSRGVTITANGGRWLAVPVGVKGMPGARGPAGAYGLRAGAAAGSFSRRGNRDVVSPESFQRRTGLTLRYVRIGPDRAYLVVDQARLDGYGVARRYSSKGRGAKLYGPRGRTIVVFVLVRQVRLNKRLDINAIAERASASLPGRIERHWR